jgi:hypothetical protein
MLQQHGAGHDLPGVLHQELEQPELTRLEHNLLAGTGDAVRQPVELEIADPVSGRLARGGRAAPPRKHLGPCQKLGEGVGFREIVVAPCPQSFDPVVDLAEGGEDQHRRPNILLAKRADQRETIELRQHPIDDEHVVVAALRQRVTVEPVGGVVGNVPASRNALTR